MLVFAVETSCDETSVCILNKDKKILSHIVYSQEEHKKFGGVIPELASRSHLQILQKISKNSLIEANIDINDIDIFCSTCGPGLIGGLLVGSTFTKSLAIGLHKPFVPINHLEGHLLSTTFNNKVEYPYIAFLLTGGHTQIYLIKSVSNYILLGETLDDAVGEAFDKVAKILKMPYPGGPEIEKKAKLGNKLAFNLPHPLHKKKDLNFSFSGIKTAINLIVNNNKNMDERFVSDVAASFQNTIINIIESKTLLTLEHLKKRKINVSQISLVGGVAANQSIYKKIKKIAHDNDCSIIMPPMYMLSDNAAMIGWACIQKCLINTFADLHFKANPRLTIEDSI
ncbi:tRNA (adenosine(37)-N6)-threonylcarbamoyltransferase complex transferase subunit TsaD [Alphaproteobacteria bacterium]|nr:tRNA (adenosine(37)-N6)-threonylcarbamoyltransferase complex transferase subunit TsaD [Alphaproteobacteria bacterium]